MDLVLKKSAKIKFSDRPILVQNKRERLLELRDRLENAQCRFNLSEDEQSIEAVIYEIKSIEATIKTLLQSME